MRLKVELMHQNTFKDNKKFVPDIFLYGFKENDPIRFMHNIAHIEVKFVCSLPTKVALSDSINLNKLEDKEFYFHAATDGC